MLEDDPGGVAVRMLTTISTDAILQMVGQRLELIAIRSAAVAVVAILRVQQHQQLTLDSPFLHRAFLVAGKKIKERN